MTTIEVRFYCVTKPYTTWSLGTLVDSIPCSRETIMSGRANPFLLLLFHELSNRIEHNIEIFFEETTTTKYQVYFAVEDDTLIINVWAGHCEPKCQVLGWDRTIMDGIPMHLLMLAHGSHLADRMNLILTVVNSYISNCINRALRMKKKYCRFELDDISAMVMISHHQISDADHDPELRMKLRSCPKTHVPCEMILGTSEYFVCVNKDSWFERGPITRHDILIT